MSCNDTHVANVMSCTTDSTVLKLTFIHGAYCLIKMLLFTIDVDNDMQQRELKHANKLLKIHQKQIKLLVMKSSTLANIIIIEDEFWVTTVTVQCVIHVKVKSMYQSMWNWEHNK